MKKFLKFYIQNYIVAGLFGLGFCLVPLIIDITDPVNIAVSAFGGIITLITIIGGYISFKSK